MTEFRNSEMSSKPGEGTEGISRKSLRVNQTLLSQNQFLVKTYIQVLGIYRTSILIINSS